MIRINNRFEMKRDSHCWNLIEYRDGIGKGKNEGKPIRTPETTYHASLVQVCDAVIDRSLGGVDSLAAIPAMLAEVKGELLEAIREAGNA